MTYTRSQRDAKYVTFEVSWIEEKVNIISFGDLSRQAVNDFANNNHDTLIEEMPVELMNLLNDCSHDEFVEFVEAYSAASRDEDAERKAMQKKFAEVTRAMMGGLKATGKNPERSDQEVTNEE